MSLTPGSKLGPYEIVAPLGAGGMGEVYRARDTRLGRDVAIKVLPAHLSEHPEVRQRFEREARAVSSLNHPHICTLYDVGREDGVDFLVMELIEGETLAARLERGALPPDQLLRYGTEIADALDRAHRSGLVHRDLKPGNVMLTRAGTKLLDFGLARATAPAAPPGSAPSRSQTPTLSQPLTAEGSIVGTFQYMAPEQLEGKEADVRSDLFAFGAVLYEMATGKRAFEGKSQASLIAAILEREPAPISTVAPLMPPGLDQLVRACLAKDPEQRVQTAHDAKLQLQWIAEGGSKAGVPAPVALRRRVRERLAWGLAAALAVTAAALGALHLRPSPREVPAIFTLTPPGAVSFVDLPRISPDGTRLAFNASDSMGVGSIWVRPMNSLEAQRLPGTEGATRPFWSPDSRYLAFFSGGKLKKIDTVGGPPQTVCDAPRGADGSWGREGVILFDGTTQDTIQKVPASGGVPTGAMVLDRGRGETFAAWPQFLPDGKHFLYITYGQGAEDRTLKIGSLDGGKVEILGPASSRAEYASGHLLFVKQGTLLAQPFDPRARKLKGEAAPVADGVEFEGTGNARFSASTEGTLVYRSGGEQVTRRLVWVDRAGRQVGTVGGPGNYESPALSPDGTQLAVKVFDPSGLKGDIWVWDLNRDVGSRLTFATDDASDAVWSPDGKRILYSADRGARTDLFVKPFGGASAESLLFTSDAAKFGEDWSPDGQTVTITARGQSRRWDVLLLSVSGRPTATPYLASEFSEYGSRFSPDGRWLAYTSFESGSEEVYLQAFPGPGGKWRISTQGGSEPAWRGDGRELFYLAPDRKLMAVALEPGDPPRIGLPQRLFDAPVVFERNLRNRFVATRDGQRFLLLASKGERQLGPTTVVLHWPQRMGRK